MSPEIRYFVGIGDSINVTKQVRDDFSILAQSKTTKLRNSWHTIEIRGYGGVLNILLDDKLLIKYKDTENPILSGGIGLETGGGSEFLIDDVEIKIITPEDVVYP